MMFLYRSFFISMNTSKTKTTLSLNFHKMKKTIHKNLCCFGHFYKKHWKVLVGAKVVLLAVVLTLSFTVRSNNGKMIQHGAAPIYAEGLCGNGKCDNIPGRCKYSSNDCSSIDDMDVCTSIS